MLVNEDIRKLASVEEILEINPIAEADAIEAAKVRGWTVVVRKERFRVGDKVVFFEVDSALPLEDSRFAELLTRMGPKTAEDGKQYHVLKTAKLRGVYSQGFILPIVDFENEINENFPDGVEVGDDLTPVLNIRKWEIPVPGGMGVRKGNFPTQYASKTDSERIQNLFKFYSELKNYSWTVTEKIDGTSCTVLRDENNVLRVCSRNYEIDEDGENTYWQMVNKYHELFAVLTPGDVIQCEIAGPGIQGNRLGLKEIRPFVFDFAHNNEYVGRKQWPAIVEKWAVPQLELILPETPEELISLVNGVESKVTKGRKAEGVVFHTADGARINATGGRNTFKVISNAYLLKDKS